MRFLHTADWQIGMKAAHVGVKAEEVRRARLESARHVIALASSEQAEFIVLAGDTFEHNAPQPEYVIAVHDILAGASCPVLVLPGNHDRLEPGSIWSNSQWDALPNLVVLRQGSPLQICGVEVLPCPLRSRNSSEDPTAWIQPGNLERIRLIVAHGSVPDDVIGSNDHPIPITTPDRTGADYVALGHWHSTRIYRKRMAYSGTHEQTKFGEDNSGNVLLVEIEKPGADPSLRTVPTGRLRWLAVGHESEQIMARGDLRRLYERVAGLSGPDHTLLNIKLKGVLFPDEREVLDQIAADCRRFLHARLETGDLTAAPEGDAWLLDLPPGLIQKTAIRLHGISKKQGPEARVATESLLQLFHHAREVLSC
jgi:DNA repair exonuclease SbcCD nuclease subunit